MKWKTAPNNIKAHLYGWSELPICNTMNRQGRRHKTVTNINSDEVIFCTKCKKELERQTRVLDIAHRLSLEE